MTDLPGYWRVDVNNGQRVYIVNSFNAQGAAFLGSMAWDVDDKVTQRQRTKGIYDLRINRAKFGDVRINPTFTVRLEGP